MTNTSSISAFNYNNITVSDIVNVAIDNRALKAIDSRVKDKSDLVNSLANEKKRTYALVDVKLMDYFVEAYNRVHSLSDKTAWAEREVIVCTMDSEYFKKAFGSDAAYAAEIGVSTGNLSKIKNSIKVRDKVIELTAMTGYATALIDELISPFNKLGDDFARFVRYSSITPATTCKAARELIADYKDIIAGKKRPTRKGFFFHEETVDGVKVKVEDETQAEYEKRIELERKKLEEELKAKQESEQQSANDTESEQQSANDTESESEQQSAESFDAETENPFESAESFDDESEQQSENDLDNITKLLQEQQSEQEKLRNAAQLLSESSKNMTITWNKKKRGSKAYTVNIDADTATAIFEILLKSGIITM